MCGAVYARGHSSVNLRRCFARSVAILRGLSAGPVARPRRAGAPPRTAARRPRPRRSARRPSPAPGSRSARRSARRPGGAGRLPSLPSTRTTLPVRSVCGVRRSRRRRRRRRPRRRRPWRGARHSARFVTRAIGRCSTAPAEAFAAAGVTERRAAARDHQPGRRPRPRPSAPPRRGCADPGPGRARRSAPSGRSSSASRVRIRVRVDLGDDALVVGRAGEPGAARPRRCPAARQTRRTRRRPRSRLGDRPPP